MRGNLIETLVEWQLWRTTLKMQIKAFYTWHKAKINDKVLTMNTIFEQFFFLKFDVILNLINFNFFWNFYSYMV